MADADFAMRKHQATAYFIISFLEYFQMKWTQRIVMRPAERPAPPRIDGPASSSS